MTASGARVAELIAKDDILAVIHRVARGTDRLDRDLIISGYWPDGFDDHNSFRGGPVEFADWVLTVLPHFQSTHHFLGQSRIQLDGDLAYTETYCDAHHVSHPDEQGNVSDMTMGLRYVDRFERRDGEWRIATRVCAFDWSYYVDSARVWTFGDDFTVGHRDRSDITYERF
ncbi:MAG TPA: nuclear transport factor 2 family protein [Acidimicrobiales bacterium]|nr:nuclear transport factor 2 family protein [Acidimicrobiales bacterium]